jgi:monovalent cation:proton antiporter-2 (CPA2) family protein
MEETAHHGPELAHVVALLAAGVIGAPLFKRLGLGSVLGYLAAGLAIGPYGLKVFTEPESILHVAELGVVLFLFIVGLEMRPSRLWAMRRSIFGLGLLQLLGCMALLSMVGVVLGFPLASSFVAATGFSLTSTAIVMQMLEERRQLTSPPGQRIVAILLLEDLAIVPLLALVAFLAPGAGEVTILERLTAVGIGIAAIAGLIVVGRWALNPLFGIIAAARAREVMTAAALLVVLGAALLMQVGGLSMAMGAFLAGVLLSESSYRHQLETDVEPFRGILLGLFFLGVGMALDLAVIAREWRLVAIGVLSYMTLKIVVIYAIARLLKTSHRESLERAALMAQGGEFAFVLYAAAAQVGIISGVDNAVLTATIILSMALTPLLCMAHDRLLPKPKLAVDGLETAHDLAGSIVIIGFGRFGQIASQPLLARGFEIALIDTDVEMVRDGPDFGFKVYYGDGTRLDLLHAAGAAHARAILICTDDKKTTTRIAELVRAEFPLVPTFARAFDREHVLELVKAGVERHFRETFDSALSMSEAVLVALGDRRSQAHETIRAARQRDAERLALDLSGGGVRAGRPLLYGNLQPSGRTTVAPPATAVPPPKEEKE